jgi:hypothetical protein
MDYAHDDGKKKTLMSTDEILLSHEITGVYSLKVNSDREGHFEGTVKPGHL